jgi:hypothetical protein
VNLKFEKACRRTGGAAQQIEVRPTELVAPANGLVAPTNQLVTAPNYFLRLRCGENLFTFFCATIA